MYKRQLRVAGMEIGDDARDGLGRRLGVGPGRDEFGGLATIAQVRRDEEAPGVGRHAVLVEEGRALRAQLSQHRADIRQDRVRHAHDTPPPRGSYW